MDLKSYDVPLLTRSTTGQSHRSVHFPDNERPDRCTTLDYGMATKSDAANTSTTATSNFSTTVGSAEEDEKPKHHPNDSYINPKGMVTSEGVIGMLSPFHSLASFLTKNRSWREIQSSKETVYRARRCGH
jgi:hypothetical protein